MRVSSFVSDGSITIIGLFLAAVFGFRTSRQPKSVHCPKNKPCDIPHDLAPCCPVLQLPMSSLVPGRNSGSPDGRAARCRAAPRLRCYVAKFEACAALFVVVGFSDDRRPVVPVFVLFVFFVLVIIVVVGVSRRHGVAPRRHSITSSARASKVGGTSRPSARAFFIFNAIWNFVGCSTGKLAGFAPLRILST
jgi:hypothetical protein